MMNEEAKRFRDSVEWRIWLKENYDKMNETWVVLQKVRSPVEGLRYEEAVDEAMCFGWIDSKMRRLNNHEFIQRFSPRRPRSIWSRINRDRAERLIKKGKMAKAGLRVVEEAKSNGRWEEAYTSREPPEMPDDLLKALKQNPEAYKNFSGFPNSARFMYVHWINEAKKAETRTRRIKRVVERAKQNKKPGIDM
jgi:uncharacterized protein YdeI (YjbR/CyaY-like superfamily)